VVTWSQRARADLKAVHDYIAQDSPQNAKVVAREILRRADGIETTPLGGRKVPELNDEQVREIPAYSWRILYHLREGKVFIVTRVHKRRHLEPEQIQPEG
jgi:plasmid stabilization system protein ParE